MAFDPSKFYVGVNIGWINDKYRHDLSTPFVDTWSVEQYPPAGFQTLVNAYFTHLVSRNMRVARFWVYEKFEGLDFLLTRASFVYRATDFFVYRDWPGFRDRIGLVMQAAAAHNILVYWCLLDGAAVLNVNHPEAWVRPTMHHLIETVRSNFKTDILLPFLDAVTPFEENVFAIDIGNEMDWCWAATEGGDFSTTTIIDFINEIADFIHAHSSLKCTCSFGKLSELMANKAALSSLDFFDYHRYLTPGAPARDSTGNINDHGDLIDWPAADKPCIIGEVGYNYPSGATQDDALQTSSTISILTSALTKGYLGALLWRESPTENLWALLKYDSQGIAPATIIETFIQRFTTTITSSGPGSYAAFERPLWNPVTTFIGTIPAGRMPPIP